MIELQCDTVNLHFQSLEMLAKSWQGNPPQKNERLLVTGILENDCLHDVSLSFESPRVSSPHSPSWANRCPWPKGRHACVYLAPLKAAENDDEADENGKEEEKEKN